MVAEHPQNPRHLVVGSPGRGRRGALALFAAVLALATSACGGNDAETAAVEDLDVQSIGIGGSPWGVAVDGERVWVSDSGRGALIPIDAQTRRPGSASPTGAPDPRDAGIAVAGDRLWVANLGGTVGVLDRATGAPVGRVAVGPGEPAAVAVSGTTAWVPLHGTGGGLAAIDATTLQVIRRVELPESAFAVAIAGPTVWVAGLEGRVFAVDAATGVVRRTVDLGGAPRGIAVAGGSVWVSLRDARQIVRLDETTGAVGERVRTEGQPWPVAADGTEVWVAELEGRLLRIDARSGKVAASGPVGPQARSIAVDGGDVWVAGQSGAVGYVRVAP